MSSFNLKSELETRGFSCAQHQSKYVCLSWRGVWYSASSRALVRDTGKMDGGMVVRWCMDTWMAREWMDE